MFGTEKNNTNEYGSDGTVRSNTCTMGIPHMLLFEEVLQGGKQQSKTNPDNPKMCPPVTIKD